MKAIPLIFRCDASGDVGWGHFHRCYGLAEIASQSGRYKIYFIARELPRSLHKKILQIHGHYQRVPDEAPLEEDLRILHGMFDLLSRKNIVVCIDHPDWTSEFFQELRQDSRVVLLVFDDAQRRVIPCDVLINANLTASKFPYQVPKETQVLLGPKYAIIREEIHTLKQHPTERVAENFQFLITLGGTDKWGHAITAIEAVKKSTVKFETQVVVGSQWPHIERARKIIGNDSRIHLHEDPSFFPQLLARADLVLSAAGVTTHELAYLGIPMMLTALVPSHKDLALAWEKEGLAEYLGLVEQLTSDFILDKIIYWMERDQELEDRGMAGQKIVDGKGKFRIMERVAKIIQNKRDKSTADLGL